MSVTTVRLSPETERELEALAGKLDRSKGWLINQALSEYLERQKQEQVRWRETLEAMEAVAKGRVVDAEDVHDWLRSWGTEQEQAAPEVDG
ncbi:CopG family ribbon-helix-helix protein [Haliea atlantica]|nr:transcriptional regulator [Haliea sp.]|tara:strand:- start:2331 stop:2603 length:273 start_codon:yes stop_codon:yes gene_type:complete